MTALLILVPLVAYMDYVKTPFVVAHRGGAALVPENTIQGWRLVRDSIDPEVFEFDVRISADDSLMVIHDPWVRRTTNGKGKVKNLTYKELRELDAGYHFTVDGVTFPWRGRGAAIPTLGEVLDSFPEDYFNVEIKTQGIESRVLEEILRKGAADRVMIISPHRRILDNVRSLAPAIPTAASISEKTFIFFLHKVRLDLLSPLLMDAVDMPPQIGCLSVTYPRFIDCCHYRGKVVLVATVNDSSVMRRLLEMGVDGIVTDCPDLARIVVRDFKE